jgi:dimethylaniline monooxygenase (N-oxide forming)
LELYKNVFSPEIGPSLAFIGFVQPASGGVLTMSEIQARWFAEMCKGRVKLPEKTEMEESMEKEKVICRGQI